MGDTALIIIAVAVVVLVVALVILVVKLMKTVDEVNRTITVVTKDVDILLNQADTLMAKTNTLLDDVNGKVATIDPLFTAVADLSESISKVNNTSNALVTRVKGKAANASKATAVVTLGRGASKLFGKKKTKDKK
ncbi:hypothetical protein Hs30E_09370 [Lactococcus hodotermopsidis]|uniref:General stress protein n=1 Tax=Pseudolactococcus hodotermopsidis TaxID=2709157 RepID=A0A6A0BC13_9LACT|nr:DUF948 domain-containing protein [Lactococcus hodotermopsidis]GFH42386.1 hypothetical protein Hs30E_09370 [Lactococcus hodotermopsidis]